MQNLSGRSDEHLINQFKQTGDSKAISTLIDRYQELIYQKCLGYVKDKDAAADLSQEVLIKLFLKLKSYQSQAKFSTWLFSVIHNTSIDFLRKHKKSVRNILIEKLLDQLEDLVEDENDIPEKISIQILDELLEQLTPEDKMLLLMKYKERHPIKEIQKILNLSESAIKMRLKRARDRVNKLHKKYLP
ncbi:MAG: RNA polymerase sigma factor [Cyclobacteriaceae bacterium]|nr:MAG: RNA polymerase sigma factor [Cyclobacteriaceae bacterium]